MSTAIEVHELVKRFGDVTAVDGVSFDIKTGETFALAGPDGAGKSTLLRLLATLLPPTSGSATVNGFDVVRRSHEVRRSIGVVWPATTSHPELTVDEHVRLFATLHGVRRAELTARVSGVLESLELQPWADTPVRQLAVAERRRVEMARALVHEPRVLLLDEPTAGLDAAARENAWTMLRKIMAGRDLTVLLTAPDADGVRTLCDRVVVMEQGRFKEARG